MCYNIYICNIKFKNMSAAEQTNDGGGQGVFAEEEANRKRQKKEQGKAQINQSVDQAKRLIING
jgi:hypothetical protein